MRVTVFGATGLLGKPLMRAFSGDNVTGFGSKDVDIRDSAQVGRALQDTRPEWVVQAAAYTDVDGCETNRQLAFDVNCQGAVNVATSAKKVGAKLLQVSTDYVFDGTKGTPYEIDDPRCPRSVYGESKAKAEVELLRIFPECCIVRTAWLFGVGGKCFPDTILRLAQTKPDLDVVDDQRGSPTHAPDLARAIVELCRNQAQGIVHVTNRGECTWFDFARQIVSDANLKTIVRPTTSDKFVRPAPRPKYSVLSSRSLERYEIAMPTWQGALNVYLQQRVDIYR